MSCKREYLICYDYGMGGPWGIMNALSPEEILNVYPELLVLEVSDRPAWMSAERLEGFRDTQWHDIDGAPWGILNAVLTDRKNKG